jgi:hypothetical protein
MPREKAMIRIYETIKVKSSQKPLMAKAKKDNGEKSVHCSVAGTAAIESS